MPEGDGLIAARGWFAWAKAGEELARNKRLAASTDDQPQGDDPQGDDES